MDTVSRLIGGCLLLLACASAWSYGLVTSSGTTSRTEWGTNRTTTGTSPQPNEYTVDGATASCNIRVAYFNAMNNGRTYTYTSNNATQCVIGWTTTAGGSGSDIYTINNRSATVAGCPANAAITSNTARTTCTCASGYQGGTFGGVSPAASCSAYTCPTGRGPIITTTGASPAASVCASDGSRAGCTLSTGSGIATTDTSGVKTYYTESTYTGSPCQDNVASPPGTPAAEHPQTNSEKCALGRAPPMCAATVNGQSVCVTCGSSSGSKTETTTTPAGAASAPTGVQAGTKTTTTDCNGANCTTTTTYKDAGGTVIGTSVQAGPGTGTGTGAGSGSGAGAGGGDSSIGVSCAAGAASITCDGDAIQCQIAREQYRRSCEFFEKTSTETALAATAVTDGVAGSTDHPKRTPDTQSLASGFDQTNLVSGGCIADRTLTVGGRTVTFGLSALCTPAGWLANVLVGMTALACLGIAFKGT